MNKINIHCAYDKIVKVDLIKPNPKNPNTHPGTQIDMLVKIIKEHGWRCPITISNRSGMIVRGHGRYMAALQGGFKTAPVDYQDYDSDQAEIMDLIADNKIAELSIVDDDLATELLDSLDVMDLDMELAGFEKIEPPEIKSSRELQKEFIQKMNLKKPFKKIHTLISIRVEHYHEIQDIIEQLTKNENVERVQSGN